MRALILALGFLIPVALPGLAAAQRLDTFVKAGAQISHTTASEGVRQLSWALHQAKLAQGASEAETITALLAANPALMESDAVQKLLAAVDADEINLTSAYVRPVPGLESFLRNDALRTALAARIAPKSLPVVSTDRMACGMGACPIPGIDEILAKAFEGNPIGALASGTITVKPTTVEIGSFQISNGNAREILSKFPGANAKVIGGKGNSAAFNPWPAHRPLIEGHLTRLARPEGGATHLLVHDGGQTLVTPTDPDILTSTGWFEVSLENTPETRSHIVRVSPFQP